MNKQLLPFLFAPFWAFNQSYAPAAGQPGSTAIHKDSSSIVAWATGGTLVRGYQQIDDISLGLAEHGTIDFAFGPANGVTTSVVSLGDGGQITLTFARPIVNNEGPDFAVFENGLNDNFLELAFVEVSSDGEHFVRFPNYSETPTDVQVNSFGSIDPRNIHNLAGKYRVGYGTPFDLEDLVDSTNINLNNITHVRIIDVVGTIDIDYASRDSEGRIINDPFPTPFPSSGFDLNGVGVIHQGALKTDDLAHLFSIYPNPATTTCYIQSDLQGTVTLLDLNGRTVLEQTLQSGTNSFAVDDVQSGIYLLQIQTALGTYQQKISKR